MRAFFPDIRCGLRIFTRTPAVTALIIVALALGIGANSAMFSVLDAMLWHPVQYADPSTLTIIWDRDSQGLLRGTSAANLLAWRSARSFSHVAGWTPSTYLMTNRAQPVQVRGAQVTANLFDALGVRPILGRTFLPGEDALQGGAAARVAVISYGLWQDALAGDPHVLGRTIVLNDTPCVVIGVMPRGFELLNARHQVWLPAVLDPTDRDYRYLLVLARRIAPLAEAAAEMTALSRALAEAYPASNRGWSAQVDDFQSWLVNRSIRTRLLLLFGAVGLVLLLACSNVASLLLARSAARSREMAVRVSLGATRGQIMTQLLAESVLLSLAGGAAGLGLAALLIRSARAWVPAGAIPTTAEFSLNPRVVLFTCGLSILTGVIFGLAPATVVSRTNVQETLQDAGQRSVAGSLGRRRFWQLMVALEVAAALVLLSGAALMVRSLQRLAAADVGVEVTNVLAQRVFLPVARYDAGRALRFHLQALERVSALPGVASAAVGSNLPLARTSMGIPADLESTPPRPIAEMPEAGYVSVSPGYFKTLGIPLRQGRDFTAADTENAPLVVIVNDAFARRFSPGASLVGQRLRLNQPLLGVNNFGPTVLAEIVGQVGNVASEAIGAAPEAIVYAPLAQNLWSAAVWLVIKAAGDSSGLAPAVRGVVASLDPNQALDATTSMQEIFSTRFAEPRFQSRLMGAFAALALVLAVVGVYGLNAYVVAQRRREIGVRMALGATPSEVVAALVGQGMKVTGTGLLIGLPGAVAASSTLRSVLADVDSLEPWPLLGATVLLLAAAALACYVPARRAASIDPSITLRQE